MRGSPVRPLSALRPTRHTPLATPRDVQAGAARTATSRWSSFASISATDGENAWKATAAAIPVKEGRREARTRGGKSSGGEESRAGFASNSAAPLTHRLPPPRGPLPRLGRLARHRLLPRRRRDRHEHAWARAAAALDQGSRAHPRRRAAAGQGHPQAAPHLCVSCAAGASQVGLGAHCLARPPHSDSPVPPATPLARLCPIHPPATSCPATTAP